MTDAGPAWVAQGLERARLLLGGDWAASLLHGSGGGQFTSNVVRLTAIDSDPAGDADSGDSVVVKLIQRNDVDESAPLYWRRELDLYESSWLADILPDDLTIPACRHAFTTDEAAVIVMEDVPFDDRDQRTVSWYERLATALGRLAAVGIDGPPPWLSRDFVLSETEALVSVAPQLIEARSEHVGPMVDSLRAVLERLVVSQRLVTDRLGALPVGFGHLDAFSRNAAEVDGRLVAIDWAYAGLAPVGTDAAAIVVLTCLHGDADRIGTVRLYDAVVAAFIDGYHQAGGAVPAGDLRASIDLLVALRWVGFLGQVNAVGDAIPEVASSIAARPFDQLTQAWADLSSFVQPLAEATLLD